MFSWLTSVVATSVVAAAGLPEMVRQVDPPRMIGVGSGQQEVHQEGPVDRLLIRVRATAVLPETSIRSSIAGSVDVSHDYVPEVDVSYALTRRWALEGVVGATRHDVRLGDVAVLDQVDLGSVRILPPSLIVQFRTRPDATLRPYLGAGLSYTVFFDVELPEDGAFSTLEYDNALGYGLQVGFDVGPSDSPWSFNVDGKWVGLETDAHLDRLPVDVSLDTWLISAGVGIRLGRGPPGGSATETVRSVSSPRGG